MPGDGKRLTPHIPQVLIPLQRLKRFFPEVPFHVHPQKQMCSQRLREVAPFDLD